MGLAPGAAGRRSAAAIAVEPCRCAWWDVVACGQGWCIAAAGSCARAFACRYLCSCNALLCLAGGLLGRLQAKAVQRLLGVAVQLVRVEIADVTLRYVQVCRAAAFLGGWGGCRLSLHVVLALACCNPAHS